MTNLLYIIDNHARRFEFLLRRKCPLEPIYSMLPQHYLLMLVAILKVVELTLHP